MGELRTAGDAHEIERLTSERSGKGDLEGVGGTEWPSLRREPLEPSVCRSDERRCQ
ncbi:MAG: hypothetical protein M3N33_08380 [Actinomycetota bacterium]|nr:hypothetical protein [Actinomycetota bacterium]